MADNTKERTQAEAQFKKTQEQKEGAEAMATYVAEAEAVRAKTARLRELIPAPEQHESAYLLPENAVDGGVVFGI